MAKTTDGTWRPDTPFLTTDGLKVTMRRAAGLTPKGILDVPMRFQAPPLGAFPRPYRFNWATFDTVSGGQHSRPMGAQLLDLRIDTLLMDRLVADATTGVVVWDDAPDPQRVLEELRFIAGADDDRKGPAAPFRLVVNQPAVWEDPVVDMVATLTGVEPSQQPGEIGTEYLSLSFLEYPELKAGRQHRNEQPAKDHKVSLGKDDLYELAKRYLHSPSKWREIAKANGITGVSPGSESDLATWMRRHHKRSLRIPSHTPRGRA
jgi:hypothetical protein